MFSESLATIVHDTISILLFSTWHVSIALTGISNRKSQQVSGLQRFPATLTFKLVAKGLGEMVQGNWQSLFGLVSNGSLPNGPIRSAVKSS